MWPEKQWCNLNYHTWKKGRGEGGVCKKPKCGNRGKGKKKKAGQPKTDTKIKAINRREGVYTGRKLGYEITIAAEFGNDTKITLA